MDNATTLNNDFFSNLDTSVNPLEDFYSFSCGHWLANNPVPPDKSRWGAFNELMETNMNRLREILEDCERHAQDGDKKTTMLGNFYRSAMDTDIIERAGFQPITEFLSDIDSIKTLDSVRKMVTKLHRVGLAPLYRVFTSNDYRNSSVYSLYIYQGGLSLPDRDYYIQESFSQIRRDYLEHLSRMFSLLGMEKEKAESSAASVLEIETQIAKHSRSRVELRDSEKNYNPVEFNQLKIRFPELGLPDHLKGLQVPGIEFTVIGQPEYFEFLSGFIAERSLDDLKLYLKWQVLHSASPFLFSEIEQENFDMFGRKLMGQKYQEPRWKKAVGIIDDSIGELLGEKFVEKYFTKEARERMAIMVDDIKSVFLERLRKISWMGEKTRERAIRKFERFRTKIGHPDKFRDYNGLKIEPDDLLGNIIRSQEFEIRRQMLRCGGNVDRNEWLMTPPTVNAYFSPNDNEIVFPAGILQPPFFDLNADDAINYGAIGAVISHEITHGYDDQGRRFDESGNLSEWWSPEDGARFKNLADKVVKLYSSAEVLPGLHVNGELTLGENIADIGGVSIAFEALNRRLLKDPSLDRVVNGFTPQQRFFISFAQIWRSNSLEPTTRMLLTVDTHSPDKIRGTLPVYNHPEFWNVFQSYSKGNETAKQGRDFIEIW